ncbi:MAG: hypothetical protein CBB80_002560 [Synechococcus sp. TMED20]|jgi:hypothetical protein|nr:MAG: hypothetical protein CBB80_002560 [Synechococcus sp. TMED20]|tara:strand:+ start:627 stop:866 length:240 start_codon:yes stop_codon:yes gene_type:complete
MNTQQRQVMQERISQIAYPDHYQQMKDKQQALSNGHQPGLLNLSDALEQNARSTPNNKDDQQKVQEAVRDYMVENYQKK